MRGSSHFQMASAVVVDEQHIDQKRMHDNDHDRGDYTSGTSQRQRPVLLVMGQ